MEECRGKTYFTEITENEKRLLNIIRTFITPFGDMSSFLDNQINTLVNHMVERAVRTKAIQEALILYEGEGVKLDPEDKMNLITFQQCVEENESFFADAHEDEVKKMYTKIIPLIVEVTESEVVPIVSEDGEDQTKAMEKEKDILDKIIVM